MQNGPRSVEPGYASVCEAYGGFRSLNGFPDREPVRPNLSLGDTLAGLHAAFGTVMALLHRQRLGVGQKGGGQVVDASISESVFNMLESCITEAAEAGVSRGPSGSTISDVVPSGTFQTKSGKHVIIGGNGDSVYSRLMAAIGRPDITADHPQFATNNDRCMHVDLIMSEISKYCAEHTLDEVVATMSTARVPCGPILTVSDILHDEHYKARGMFEKASPPKGGREMTVPAMLPVLSKTPGATRWTGPDLGEHTEEVLRDELGYSDQKIAELRASGAI
ncbi:CoA-transferase family III domain-containing protein [Dunaliella salina]|uniref:CoA-transferase family III domain-containing protein n=1 Tax=Dunaliella salina TaxID=3046 RepID=A0ABQ7G397_DUNSA|nr:CoA-transferase family III domain-containing protein [Dunaliella salina]|eukprot:KAF5829072.1 CoA-transferase family III domain-containing protein [Dunaliella salina]